MPCDPSELTHFRKRIGTDGAERILASTIDLHGEKAKEKEVVVDTTVQEKNITFPTDTKLAAKIVRGELNWPTSTESNCARVSSARCRNFWQLNAGAAPRAERLQHARRRDA